MKSKIPFLVICCFLIANLVGCEAFVRKFTRKHKKESQGVEMVLAPQVYEKPKLSKEEEYRQYFLYWKSWQDELVEALAGNSSHKRQLSCATEALSNLAQVRQMLNEGKKKELDIYINQLKELQEKISSDIYGNNNQRNHYSAERIKMNVLRLFSYSKIKDSLT